MGILSDVIYANAAVAKDVSLEKDNVTVPDLMKLFDKALDKNRNLRSLNLSNTTLGGFGIDLICKLLSKNSNIQKLILNNCHISTYNLESFLKEVEKNSTSIKEISLEGNPFDEAALNKLKIFQMNHPSIVLRYSPTPVARNPEDIYASPFEDGSALKGKYK